MREHSKRLMTLGAVLAMIIAMRLPPAPRGWQRCLLFRGHQICVYIIMN